MVVIYVLMCREAASRQLHYRYISIFTNVDNVLSTYVFGAGGHIVLMGRVAINQSINPLTVEHILLSCNA